MKNTPDFSTPSILVSSESLENSDPIIRAELNMSLDDDSSQNENQPTYSYPKTKDRNPYL
jgi:hypothetical protein